MPRIPKYERQVGRQVQQVQPADVRIQPTQAQFGTAEAQAIQGLGQTISGLGQVLQNKQVKDDKQTALDLATQFSLEQQDITSDYMGRELKQANGSTIEWQKQTQEQQEKLLADHSPRVQEYARNLMTATYKSNRSRILTHETSEDKRGKEISYNTFKMESINNILEMPTKENFDTQVKQINGAFIAMNTTADGKSKYDDKTMQMLTQSNTDQAMTATVNSLLEGTNYSQADELLKGYKDKISRDVYKELDAKINDGKYIEIANNIVTSGMSATQQILATDKIKDSGLRKKVRKEVEYKQNLINAKIKSEYVNYRESVWEKVYNDPTFQVPTTSLESKDEQAMMRFQKQAVKEANGQGGDIDWDRYSEYKQMSSEKRKKLAVSEILKINDRTMQKEIIDLQTNDIKGVKQAQAERLRKPLVQAKDMVSGMSKFDKKTPEGSKLYNQYIEQFNKKLALIPDEDQTEERVGQLINSLLSPISVPETTGILTAGGRAVRHVLGKDKKFRFETYYTPEKEDVVFEGQLPENIPEGAKYDKRSNRYYIEYGDIIKIYDPVTGLLLKQGRKNG